MAETPGKNLPLCDRDIRAALHVRLKENHAHEADTIIIDELSLCQGDARVDLAVVNGSLSGYEIKSDRDTLLRLPKQRFIYGRCFDEMTIVVGTRHVSTATSLVPRWWGIWEAIASPGGVTFRIRRETGRQSRISPRRIVKLIWKNEALNALKKIGIMSRTKARRDELWKLLLENVSHDHLREIVRDALKARGDWRSGPTPFRRGDSLQSSSMSQRFQMNRDWLLSRGSQSPQD